MTKTDTQTQAHSVSEAQSVTNTETQALSVTNTETQTETQTLALDSHTQALRLAHLLAKCKSIKEARSLCASELLSRSLSQALSQALTQALSECKSIKEARSLAQSLSETKTEAQALALFSHDSETDSEAQALAQSLAQSQAHSEAQTHTLSELHSFAQKVSECKSIKEARSLAQTFTLTDAQALAQSLAQLLSECKSIKEARSLAQTLSECKTLSDARSEAQRLSRSQSLTEALSVAQSLALSVSKKRSLTQAQALALTEAQTNSLTQALSEALSKCQTLAQALALCKSIKEAQTEAQALSVCKKVSEAQTQALSEAQTEAQALAQTKTQALALCEPKKEALSLALDSYTEARSQLRNAERLARIFSGSLSVCDSYSVTQTDALTQALAKSKTQTLSLALTNKISHRGSHFFESVSLISECLSVSEARFPETQLLALCVNAKTRSLALAQSDSDSLSDSFKKETEALSHYTQTLSLLASELLAQALAKRTDRDAHTRSVARLLSETKKSAFDALTLAQAHSLFTQAKETEAQKAHRDALTLSQCASVMTDTQRLAQALKTLKEKEALLDRATQAHTEALSHVSEARSNYENTESLTKSLIKEARSLAQTLSQARSNYEKATQALSKCESAYRDALAQCGALLGVSAQKVSETLSGALRGSGSYFQTLAQCDAKIVAQAQTETQARSEAKTKTQTDSDSEALSQCGAQTFSEWLSLYFQSDAYREALKKQSVTQLQNSVISELHRVYRAPLACINALNRVARSHKSLSHDSDSGSGAKTEKALLSVTEALSRLSVSKFTLSLLVTDSHSRFCEAKTITDRRSLERAKEKECELLTDLASGALYYLEPLSEFTPETFSRSCLSRLILSDAQALAFTYSCKLLTLSDALTESDAHSELKDISEALTQRQTKTQAQALANSGAFIYTLSGSEAQALSGAQSVSQWRSFRLREPLCKIVTDSDAQALAQ